MVDVQLISDIHKNEVFEIPRAKKSTLIKKRKILIKKYNLK